MKIRALKFLRLAGAAALLFHSLPALAANIQHLMTYGDMKRDYIVHTPPQYKDEGGPSLPVVLALHGGGGSAQGMEELYGLDAYADRYGMIVVYPDGVPSAIGNFHTWNAGVCCGAAKRKETDDAGFLSAVIDEVVKNFHADAAHVFVTGHSNGGMMAYRLACEIPDKIAAIASVDGQSTTSCPKAKPVPVLQIHGTLDICVLYTGGVCGGCFSAALGLPVGDAKWPCEGIHRALEQRASAYGCQPETQEAFRRGPAICETWKGCPAHGTVALCRIEGGGHHWQGSQLPGFCDKNPTGDLCQRWTSEVGPVLQTVDTNALIFGFFQKQ